ncbi:ABC transporter ATP-binding protein [Arthrobacter sp. GMC3]|uniref:ABC transporter ATP-binding protein n=1 Tax=Arthrobacter sp. GMC3 TaxID=2058894 RepID=UPI0021572A22|nr:ATP-binding cassette domain-containing protein [Arthrobacter sp. GMC3]
MNPVLEAEGIAFKYGQGPDVLAHWSHKFFPGEIVAITGPSGRGKSTLLYLLGLMLTPTSGQLLIEGESLANVSDERKSWLRAKKYGFVFQDAALDPKRPVRESITEAALYRGENPRAYEERADELLEALGVSISPKAKPGQVSGGQAQRIALCRAIIHQPSIILADEPTGNLDRNSGETVRRVFRAEAARGASVLIVTHDQDLATSCDRQIFL